jgi:thiamine kinase-like enzyme
LLKDDGKLYFLDFEYFGRDDPVKLMADFVWHPGMNLNDSQKNTWLKGISTIFKKDPNLNDRFYAAWPLYGLRWSLILLNEFLKDGWQKRVYANSDLQNQQRNKLEDQLNKAKVICRQIQVVSMECPYV